MEKEYDEWEAKEIVRKLKQKKWMQRQKYKMCIVELKGSDEFGVAFLHSKTRKNVHIYMFPETVYLCYRRKTAV
jgi:hypothetical protein